MRTMASVRLRTCSFSGWTKISGVVNLQWTGTLNEAYWYVETAAGTASFLLDGCWFNKGTAKLP